MDRLRNPIRPYAWGSRSVLAALRGRPVPSPEPEAELWIGAHPADPSVREPDGTPLTEVIAKAPAEVLGDAAVDRFGARLPYLLKVLAAAAPLSLQAHPDAAQAAAGYAAEEAAGVPRDAPQRRYPDPYHKPELLVAVSEFGEACEPNQACFRALCGFREPAASAELFAGLGVPALRPVMAALEAGNLEGAARWLLTHPDPVGLVAAVVDEGRSALAAELASAYPGDLGVLVALLLNEVELAPGEAIFMPAGNLHTYLHGTGVELMAASDNVLRGGLTPKHVDLPELLRVLRFEPLADPVRRPVPVAPGVVTWPVPVPDFALHRVRLDGTVGRAALGVPGPRLVLCLEGRVEVDDGVAAVTLGPGEAAFGSLLRSPATGGLPLMISGIGEAYVATVNADSAALHSKE